MSNYRVCIPTAGIGSRVEQVSGGLNKSLIELNYKPIISHIIDLFPKQKTFVIPVGHKGDLVKQYLRVAHPKKKLLFVNITKYIGKDSGLGLTLIKSKKFLNCPFIFISCDTIVKEKIKTPNHNWVAYSGRKLPNYRGLKISKKKKVISFLDKNSLCSSNCFNYIGLAGINDYKNFWNILIKNKNKSILEGEFYGIKNLKKEIKAYKYKWYDTGNQVSLNITKNKLEKNIHKNILPKSDEKIWFDQGLVIKYFKNIDIVKKRVNRANQLKGFVPKIIKYSKNFYSYKEIPGEIMSKVNDTSVFKLFLSRLEKFHRPVINSKNIKNYKTICTEFYKEKTLSRIKDFYDKFDINDNEIRINGLKTKKLSILLKEVNWNYICDPIVSRFHGDLHFENIIFQKKSKKFFFLDWRHEFGRSKNYGDVYYDLAKIMHGLIVSHDQVMKENFYIIKKKNNISLGIKRPKIYGQYLTIYKKWFSKSKYDLKKVNILTSIIFLNIASLHHYPYSKYLYFLGKEMLDKNLKKHD